MIDYLESALSGRDWIFIAIGVVACVLLWDVRYWLSGFTKDINEHLRWRREFDERQEAILSRLGDIQNTLELIDRNTQRGEGYD